MVGGSVCPYLTKCFAKNDGQIRYERSTTRSVRLACRSYGQAFKYYDVDAGYHFLLVRTLDGDAETREGVSLNATRGHWNIDDVGESSILRG